MAVQKIDIVDFDMDCGVIHRSWVNELVGSGDDNANRFGVRLLRKGEAVNIAGTTCVGYYTRPDGITLVLPGGAADGALYVELPEAAYAKEGRFTLSLKASGSDFAGTVRIVDGTIVRTTSGEIHDPSSVVPNLSTLETAATAAAEAAEAVAALTIGADLIIGTRYSISINKEEEEP